MQRMEQPYQMMQNPCTTDQVRFLCGPDAACLKAHLSELSPSCAMFLLKSTERARPSPEPSRGQGSAGRDAGDARPGHV